MFDDIADLYQQVILDHCKKPRNFRELPQCTCSAQGYNPLCGDKLTVYLVLKGDVIEDVRFVGSGCAISTASASLMTQSVKGKTVGDAELLFDGFRALVTSEPSELSDDSGLGKLAVFGGVREFPVRVKCATLAWHTLKSALDGSDEVAQTE